MEITGMISKSEVSLCVQYGDNRYDKYLKVKWVPIRVKYEDSWYMISKSKVGVEIPHKYRKSKVVCVEYGDGQGEK